MVQNVDNENVQKTSIHEIQTSSTFASVNRI